jgi:hypothetical protein
MFKRKSLIEEENQRLAKRIEQLEIERKKIINIFGNTLMNINSKNTFKKENEFIYIPNQNIILIKELGKMYQKVGNFDYNTLLLTFEMLENSLNNNIEQKDFDKLKYKIF